MKTAAADRCLPGRPSRTVPGSSLVGGILLGWLLTSCSSTPLYRGDRAAAPPPLSAEYVLAPVQGSGEQELIGLLRAKDDKAAQLRRAWIYLETDRVAESIEVTNAVLYGVDGPAPAEEAMARYVRGLAWLQKGDTERGRYDLERARSHALEPALQERIAKALGPGGAPETEPVRVGALPQLLSRSHWGPAPPVAGRLDPMGRIFRVTVHHSAMHFNDVSPGAAASSIRRIQKQHMQGRGYGDIGYHFLVDPAGRIWQGRDLRYQGAHSRDSNNVGNVGICLLGNFVRGEQRPTAAQVATLRRLLLDIVEKYDIPPDQVKTHRQFVVTQCPGENLQVVVDQFIHDLRQYLGDSLAGR